MNAPKLPAPLFSVFSLSAGRRRGERVGPSPRRSGYGHAGGERCVLFSIRCFPPCWSSLSLPASSRLAQHSAAHSLELVPRPAIGRIRRTGIRPARQARTTARCDYVNGPGKWLLHCGCRFSRAERYSIQWFQRPKGLRWYCQRDVDGVTVNGVLDAGDTYSGANLTVTNGLVLSGRCR